ncbi:MAG: hypothetical protein MJ137_04485 [Clostridia bacterium]|nr:hypothetical protein [Clostridia bacterium]
MRKILYLLNKNKIQQIVMSCVVYIFVVSLVVAVSLSYLSVYRSEKIHEKIIYGDYDGVILDGAPGNDYTVSAQIPIFGYIELRNHGITSLGVIDSSASKTTALQLQEGRMPTAWGEVCLEESVKYELADRISDDGELLLDYCDYSGNRQFMSVTVVGTVCNYSETQCKCSYSIEGINLPGIMFYEAPVSCQHTLSLVKLIEKNSAYGIYNFTPNRRFEAETPVLLVLLRVFFILTICIGIICLLGNQWISERSDSSSIIQLKCAGATVKYIYGRFLKKELIPLSLGIGIGTLCGWGLSVAILSKIQKSFVYSLISINPIVLLPVVITLVSVMIVIRLLFLRQMIYNPPMKEIQKDSSSVVPWVKIPRHFFHKHPFFSRGIKSFLFHSEMYIIPLLCLVVVYLVIAGSWIMMNSISVFYDKEIGYDYSLRTVGNIYAGNIEAAVQDGFPIKEKDILALQKAKESKMILASSYRRAFITENNEEKSHSLSSVFDQIESWAVNNKRGVWDSVQKELNSLGMEGSQLWVTALYAGNEAFLSELTNGKSIKDNGAVIISAGECPYAIGDNVDLTFILYDEETGFSRRNINVRVEALIPSRSSPLTNDMKSNCFCVSNALLSDIGCDFGYDSIYLNLNNSDEYQETEEIIQNIIVIENNSTLELLSRREYNESIKDAKRTAVSICLVVALCSIVCLGLNMFHNLTASHTRQKHSMIMLPILGMSKKQLRQYLFGEMMIMNILAASLAILISLVLSMVGEFSVTGGIVAKTLLSLGVGMIILTALCTGLSVFAHNNTIKKETVFDELQ